MSNPFEAAIDALRGLMADVHKLDLPSPGEFEAWWESCRAAIRLLEAARVWLPRRPRRATLPRQGEGKVTCLK